MIAILIDESAGHARAGGVGIEVVEIIETQAADLLRIFDPGIHEVHARTKAATAADIGMPAGKQPGVLVVAGHGIGFTTEHHAVGVEQKWPPI